MMLKLRVQEDNVDTATLYMKQRPLSRISTLSPTIVDVCGLLSTGRGEVEEFIKSIYKKKYGADITVTYPVLMSVRNADGKILAALGFRYADKESLFLEHYTGWPIESFTDARRSEIVEIGNLASAGHGASIFLFAALASYLGCKGVKYAAITGTQYLHTYFKRIGLEPKEICEADIKAVAEIGQQWGTYYDTAPRVLIGSVETGVKRLQKSLGLKFISSRECLIPRLHYKTIWGQRDDVI